jgi:Mg2+-importing ATPase
MSVVVKHNKDNIMCTKGSLEEILNVTTSYVDGEVVKKINKIAIKKILNAANAYNSAGMRILGVAKKNLKAKKNSARYSKQDETDMIFIGFIILYDPPRLNAKNTIQELLKYGVEPKILTGDNEVVTLHLCSIVGLQNKGVLSGPQLDSMSDDQLKKTINFVTIFVKLTPVHKERIIQILKDQQHVVGFLGDGTNDALAMHAADFSVALYNATDTAKQNADFIMKNDDISVVSKAAVVGRNAHMNIMKYVRVSLVYGINLLVTSLIASF